MQKSKIEVTNIRIKRAYEPACEIDGTRMLVDRLWPRGLSKKRAALTIWMKEIAPSTELRTWFGHDPNRFEEFSKRYRIELAANNAAVEKAIGFVKLGPVTLLYAAHDEVHNHAVVLAQYLRDVLERDGKRRSGRPH